MSETNLISRKDARIKLAAIKRAELMALSQEELVELVMKHGHYHFVKESDWERYRNYEMEYHLDDMLDGKWIIGEFCPYNGKYSAYGDWLEEQGEKEPEGGWPSGRPDIVLTRSG